MGLDLVILGNNLSNFRVALLVETSSGYGRSVLSRSTLERRMRDAINRTPKQQIRYVQISKAKTLLSDSNESLITIAGICGFEHPEYLHVMFKREVGMTPGEFRQSTLGD